MLIDILTKDFHKILTEGKFSVFYHSWTKTPDGYDMTKESWTASYYKPGKLNSWVEATAATPREAVAELYKKL